MAVEWSKALRNGWDYGFEPRPLSKRSYFASSMFNVFFQGTNADQDNRFSDKEKKLLKQMKFEEVLSKKVRKILSLKSSKPARKWADTSLNREVFTMVD